MGKKNKKGVRLLRRAIITLTTTRNRMAKSQRGVQEKCWLSPKPRGTKQNKEESRVQTPKMASLGEGTNGEVEGTKTKTTKPSQEGPGKMGGLGFRGSLLKRSGGHQLCFFFFAIQFL